MGMPYIKVFVVWHSILNEEPIGYVYWIFICPFQIPVICVPQNLCIIVYIIQWYPAKRALPAMLTHDRSYAWQIGSFWQDTLEYVNISNMYMFYDMVIEINFSFN